MHSISRAHSINEFPKELKSLWLQYHRKKLWWHSLLCLLFLVLYSLIFLLIVFPVVFKLINVYIGSETKNIYTEKIFSYPYNLIFITAGLIGCLLAYWFIRYFYYLFPSVSVCIFGAKPKASKNPTNTAINYFDHIFNKSEYVFPYIALSNNTGTYKDSFSYFKDYWVEEKKGVNSKLQDLFPKTRISKDLITSSIQADYWSIDSDFINMDESDHYKIALIHLVSEVHEIIINNLNEKTSFNLGKTIIQTHLVLEKVKGRWYILQPEWKYTIEFKDKVIPFLLATYQIWKSCRMIDSGDTFRSIPKSFERDEFVRYWDFNILNRFLSIDTPSENEYMRRLYIGGIPTSYLLTNKRIYFINDERDYRCSIKIAEITSVNKSKDKLLTTIYFNMNDGKIIQIKDCLDTGFLMALNRNS